jgi:hypothetical protein
MTEKTGLQQKRWKKELATRTQMSSFRNFFLLHKRNENRVKRNFAKKIVYIPLIAKIKPIFSTLSMAYGT